MINKTTRGSAAVWVPLVIIIIVLVMDWGGVFDSKGKLNYPKESIVENNGGKIYINKEYNFQIQIPSNLVRANDTEGNIFGFYDSNENTIVLIGGTFESNRNIDITFDELIEYVRMLNPEYGTVSNEKMIIGGLEARLLKMVSRDSPNNVRFGLLINNMNDNGVYIFMAEYIDKDPLVYDKIIKDSLLSVKFIK